MRSVTRLCAKLPIDLHEYVFVRTARSIHSSVAVAAHEERAPPHGAEPADLPATARCRRRPAPCR
jgi:hypothetical protein